MSFRVPEWIQYNCKLTSHNMGLYATKPVFGVSDEVRFKPACSATETSLKIEFSLIASLDMIFSIRRITKDVEAGLRLCCLQTPEDRGSHVEAHIMQNIFFLHAG